MREANAGVAISAAVSRNATLARKECTLFHLKIYDPGVVRVILMKSLETCQQKNIRYGNSSEVGQHAMESPGAFPASVACELPYGQIFLLAEATRTAK
jgi:hypothetical protein